MESAAARVLTAEHDPHARADLRLVLEDAGFAVCADARDGLEAVELERAHRPDLVLLNLHLPRLDGVETTRRIRAHREVPIVALTESTGDRGEQAIDAGASSYLRTPVGADQLVGAVADALGREQLVRQLRERSRQALALLAGELGYPEAWADVLERQAYARGRVWKISD